MDESLGPRAAGSPVTELRIVPTRFLLVPLLAFALAGPSHAGLFKKSAKVDPAVLVPALIETLKNDRDEKNRVAAASELDEFDAKAFPEVLPALIDALVSDPSASVRARAAESIGKVRPISGAAGYALERAVADDKSLSVRVSARAALLKYKVLGHMPGTKVDMVVQSAEPPLAAGSKVKDLGSGTVLRPTPAPIPTAAPVPPALPAVPAPKAPPESTPDSQATKPAQPQTGEPPLADAPKLSAVPTTGPAAPTPVIVIPSPPAKDAVTPVPTTPTGPTLPVPSPAPGGGPTIPKE